MNEIQGTARTVRQALKGAKYSIDYFQREYKWRDKQIAELLEDLAGKFLEEYDPSHSRTKVAEYPHYFLGSIIISKKDGAAFIVDGQQRLTSLTLLMILLRHLQAGRDEQVNVDDLIFSEKFGQKSFNIDVPERTPCMEALFKGEAFDPTERSESVQNLFARYGDLERDFPDELRGEALPYFVDWLLENVHIVEITAFSDDDAYTIFETMNDRGLSLSPTDMLKGYLLTNIDNTDKRTVANNRWRDLIADLNAAGKEVEPDFFKTWLRSQYSTKIRERRKGAKNEDFDRIGTEFHRWLRDASTKIGLKQSDDFYRFIDTNLNFYARQYLRLLGASSSQVPGLEHVLYNAQLGFTLQYLLLLAPLSPDDPPEVVDEKVGIVARYLDILLTWRLWNWRMISYSTMLYAMFVVMKDIRGLDPEPLAERLRDRLADEKETFASNDRLTVHQQNRYSIHRILARLTDFVETGSGQASRYLEYVSEGKTRYEVEHIWANHPRRHSDEFDHESDFQSFRNRIGGLLLLPKSFNASYGDLVYEKKLPHYRGQNLLAQSLHPETYERNPGFVGFIKSSGIPFRPMEHFAKADLEERGELYRQLASRVWDPASITDSQA